MKIITMEEITFANFVENHFQDLEASNIISGPFMMEKENTNVILVENYSPNLV